MFSAEGAAEQLFFRGALFVLFEKLSTKYFRGFNMHNVISVVRCRNDGASRRVLREAVANEFSSSSSPASRSVQNKYYFYRN